MENKKNIRSDTDIKGTNLQYGPWYISEIYEICKQVIGKILRMKSKHLVIECFKNSKLLYSIKK